MADFRIAFVMPNRKTHPHGIHAFILRPCGHADETFYPQLVHEKCYVCVFDPLMNRDARKN